MLHTSAVGTPLERMASVPAGSATIVIFTKLATSTVEPPPTTLGASAPPSCLKSLLPQQTTL